MSALLALSTRATISPSAAPTRCVSLAEILILSNVSFLISSVLAQVLFYGELSGVEDYQAGLITMGLVPRSIYANLFENYQNTIWCDMIFVVDANVSIEIRPPM